MTSKRMLILIFAASSLTVLGCMQLLESALSSLVQMVGAQPAPDYQNNGHVQFAVLPTDVQGQAQLAELASFQSTNVQFQVQNDDGTYSNCDYVDEKTHKGREISSLAILIDDSGSMERSYPEIDYGDVCPTCPHDPANQRASASAQLIEKVLRVSADSGIALYDFGPDPDPGRTATRVLHSLSSDEASLRASLSQVDGSQLAGTPLWDALAEVILEHQAATQTYESALQSQGKALPDEPVARFLLVISDGDDRDSQNYNLEQVIALANENNVIVHAVGLGPASALDERDGFHDAEQISAIQNLQALASRTGGFYGSVESPSTLGKLFSDIAHSMTHGYLVGTYRCQPRGNSTDATPRTPASGERVRGIMLVGQSRVPWTIVAP